MEEQFLLESLNSNGDFTDVREAFSEDQLNVIYEAMNDYKLNTK